MKNMNMKRCSLKPLDGANRRLIIANKLSGIEK